MARYTFGEGAAGFGALAAAMGAGAVLGAVLNAGRSSQSIPMLGALGIAFRLAMLGLAAAPGFGVALAALVLVGAASAAFTATTNSLMQLAAEPAMRGRVMALWSVVYLGSTPVGGPVVGWLAEHAGARAGVLVGAAAALAAGGGLLFVSRQAARSVSDGARPDGRVPDRLAWPGVTPALERRGARVPRRGFGTFEISPRGCVEAVSDALAAGYRHLDTAAAYGNEAEVGRTGLDRDTLAPTACRPGKSCFASAAGTLRARRP